MTISTTPTKSAFSPLLLVLAPILGLVLYILPGFLASDMTTDGKQLTVYNLQVTNPANWSSIWTDATPSHLAQRFAYRPVQAAMQRLVYGAWQESPSSYHALSLFLYLGVLVLFLLLAGSILRRPGARLAAALTLTLHPMFTQSVANVAAQGVLLSLLAMLGACYVLQLYRQGTLRLGWGVALVALLAFIAMGAHEMGFLLPVWLIAVAALTRVAPGEAAAGRAARRKRDEQPAAAPRSANLTVLAFALPLVALIALFLVMRQRALGAIFPTPLNAFGVPVMTAAPKLLCAYLARLFWPVHPTLFYPMPESWSLTPIIPVAWMLVFALAAFIVMTRRRWPAVALALILLLSPLAALTHLLPLTIAISEQPLAFALPGLALLVGALAELVAGAAWSFPPAPLRARILTAALCVVWVGMAWQTWARLGEWSRTENLLRVEAARHPASAAPLVELTDVYVRQDAVETARTTARQARRLATRAELDRIMELEATLAVNQKDDQRLRDLIDEAMAQKASSTPEHLVRMSIFAQQRDFKREYADLLRQQLKFYPDSFEACYALAQYELDEKNLKEAIRLGSLAIKNARGRAFMAKAFERYGIILAEAGQAPVAEKTLLQALQLDKGLYNAYIYLARIYWGRKDLENAKGVVAACFANAGARVTSYRDLVELYTGILESQNRPQEAVDWMAQQMDFFPSDVQLQLYGARYMIEFGRYDRAESAYRTLIQRPDIGRSGIDVMVGMGLVALRGQNDRAQAAKFWRKALELDPLNDEAKRFMKALEGGDSTAVQQAAATAAPATQAAAIPTSATAASAMPAPSSASVPAIKPPTVSGGGLSLGQSAPPPAATPAPAIPPAPPTTATATR